LQNLLVAAQIGHVRALRQHTVVFLVDAPHPSIECDDKKWEPVFVKNRTITNIQSVMAFHGNVITL